MNLFKGDDLILYTGTVGSDKVDTTGYQTISNSEGSFAGTESIADGTYRLNIEVDADGSPDDLSIVLASKTVADLPAVIQTALRTATSRLETVALTAGKIITSSITEGATSKISITEGVSFLGALSSIEDVTASIDAAVDGVAAVAAVLTGSGFAATDYSGTNLVFDVVGSEGTDTITLDQNEDPVADVAAAIDLLLVNNADIACTASEGEIVFTATTAGSTQSITVNNVVTGDLSTLGFTTADTVAGTDATAGIQTIANSEGVFAGTEVMPDGVYHTSINIDDAGTEDIYITLADDKTVTEALALLQVALRAVTSSTETVAIANDKITVTSATTGASSSVVISDNGGLIAALSAIADVTAVIDDAVDGAEGAIQVSLPIASEIHEDAVFGFVASVQTSAGVNKAGLKFSYNTTSGVFTISDDTTTTELLENDKLTFIGGFAYASESV